MAAEQQRPLTTCVNMLGQLLGQVIAEAHGQQLFDTVERIRQLAKSSRTSAPQQRAQLTALIKQLPQDQLLLVARAFSQFLNLANIAEQLYNSGVQPGAGKEYLDFIVDDLRQFAAAAIDRNKILTALERLQLNLVLTAHPTEITRRTLIEKQNRIYSCLETLENRKLDVRDESGLVAELKQLIAQWWHTDEIRVQKPTPVDEAVWGFAVIENSLWEAVPQFVNQLTDIAAAELDMALPIEYAPVQFTSWMGGDRDGNPNVTAQVTEEVIRLARWKAADLFLTDINHLISELSMYECTPELRALAGSTREPYRAVLKELRLLLHNTLQAMDDLLKGRDPKQVPLLEETDQLWQPLYSCYQSLHACGMGVIANGKLRDTLRRVRCFGCFLLRLDIRQESNRHTQVLSELTQVLALGNYAEWDEPQRMAFLTAELANRRPLMPRHWQPSAGVQEVLDTFAMLAAQPRDALGVYIISMAKAPSDVLAVQLLLKEFACPSLPIAPLFETLDDLNHSADIVQSLLATPIYRDSIDNYQMVMIGYSDSAKDAGVMAASWAQYRAQEAVIKVCHQAGVQLTLFHGRGGTTGRGGAPAHAALLSQPPGSLENGLRVTEQGEMIRFKLGLPQKAVNTFGLYASAMLQSNLVPPPEPEPAWRNIMDELANISARSYRQMVFEETRFLDYFQSATPINELSKLPLGSRPAKRRADGGVENLRAIPWSFAWSQNRLMFPAWYGAGESLQCLIERGDKLQLEAMCQRWPFFSTRISMLEMVYAKTDSELSAYYESSLVDESLYDIGQRLRQRLHDDIGSVLSIVNDETLLRDLPWLKQSLKLRNTYIDPLNLLQVELLLRDRKASNPEVERALMVTIAGVAAGLRNTG